MKKEDLTELLEAAKLSASLKNLTIFYFIFELDHIKMETTTGFTRFTFLTMFCGHYTLLIILFDILISPGKQIFIFM